MSFVRSIARQFSGLSSVETVEQKLEQERLQRLELLESHKQTRQANSMFRGGGTTLQDELLRQLARQEERVRQDSFEMVSRSREDSFESIHLSSEGSFDANDMSENEPDVEPQFVLVSGPEAVISVDEKASIESMSREDFDVVPVVDVTAFAKQIVEEIVGAALLRRAMSRSVATQTTEECISQGTKRAIATQVVDSMFNSSVSTSVEDECTAMASEDKDVISLVDPSASISLALAAEVVKSTIVSAISRVERTEVERSAMAAEEKDEFPEILATAAPSTPAVAHVAPVAPVVVKPAVPSAMSADMEIKCRHKALASEALKEFYAAREAKKQRRSVENRLAEVNKVRELSQHVSWAKVMQLIDDPEEHSSFATMRPPVARMFHVLRSSAA
ncbi:hypothetical protein LEN26_007839 [Aphanomyces euteiches]|nr:hypothetical protein LEN26_007839 [Aphanomyces euteiches]